MITMGCYNTLATMRNRLENMKPSDMDAQDQKSLALVRKWMSGEKGSNLEWGCARVECVFHKDYCLYGQKSKVKSRVK
jgi:hypothetical protein